METVNTKDSKLLGRTELTVVFKDKAGMLTRRDAVKEVAQQMHVEESQVGLISLYPETGTKTLTGKFHIYGSKQAMKDLHLEHLNVRMLTKEEREKLKQDKKKAEQPKAK